VCETLSGPWEPTTIKYDNDKFRVVLPPVWGNGYYSDKFDDAMWHHIDSMTGQELQEFREYWGLREHKLSLVGEKQTITLSTDQRSQIGIIPEEIKTVAIRSDETPSLVALFKQGKEVAQAYCEIIEHTPKGVSEVQARLKIAGKDESAVITRKYGCLLIYGDFEHVGIGTMTEELMRAKVTRGTLRFLCDNAAERKDAKTAKEVFDYLRAENIIDHRTKEWKPAQAFRGRFQCLYEVAIGKQNINGWRYWVK